MFLSYTHAGDVAVIEWSLAEISTPAHIRDNTA
jgi:hypothetical protein